MKLFWKFSYLVCIIYGVDMSLSTTDSFNCSNCPLKSVKTNSGYSHSVTRNARSLRVSRGFGTKSSRILEGMDLNEDLTVTLLEVFQGPLAGKNIILHVDTDVEGRIDIDKLLSRSERPLFVSWARESELDEKYIPEDDEGRILNGIFNSPCNHKLSEDDQNKENDYITLIGNSTVYRQNELHPDVSGAVFVYITAGKSDIIRWFGSNSMAGLLVIALKNNCDIYTLRRISLTHQTPNVALFCPRDKRNRLINRNDDQITDDVTSAFEVSTWLPYHPRQKLHFLGLWSLVQFAKWDDLFVDRFTSFYNCTLYVSSDDSDPPFFFFNGVKDNYDGVGKRIMLAIGQWLNFSIHTTEHALDDRWGEFENGTWHGMLGHIYRREKQVVFNYFSLTEQRAQDFDFSVSHDFQGFGFSLKIPPPLPRWLSLTYPFTVTVWGGIMIALVLAAIAFYFLPQEDVQVSPIQTFLIVAQGLMNQSVNQIPSASHFRVFFGVWCISAYIIVLSYTCNLIAVLTVPAYPRRIRDVEELAKSDFRICMLDYGEFVPDALATSEDPDLFTLGSKIDLVPTTEEGFFGQEQCIAWATEGSHSHIESFSYLKILFTVMGHSQKVYYLHEQIYEANLAFFFPKHTPWKFKIDIGMLQLLETGWVDKYHRDIMDMVEKEGERLLYYDPAFDINGTYTVPEEVNKTKQDTGDEEPSEQALSLAHLQGPFYIFLFGTTTATLFFFLEIIRSPTKKKV